MTSPLDSLVTITFVADASTPSQYLPTAGRVLSTDVTIQVGRGGHLAGIPGVYRQGTTGLEFLMMAEVPGPGTDAGPVWAQQLRADLTAALAAAHDDRVLIYNHVSDAITKLDLIISGAARQADLLATKAEVDAIKTKVGA